MTRKQWESGMSCISLLQTQALFFAFLSLMYSKWRIIGAKCSEKPEKRSPYLLSQAMTECSNAADCF